jgi:hypothetical protein
LLMSITTGQAGSALSFVPEHVGQARARQYRAIRK